MTAPTQVGQHVRMLPNSRTPHPDAPLPRDLSTSRIYIVRSVERAWGRSGPAVRVRGISRGFFAWRFEVVNPDCPTTIRKLGLPT